MIYKWKDGARQRADAQVIGDYLEDVRQSSGGNLTADVVVQAAIPSNSPIHPLFEWDDRTAAGEYRREQARRLVRSIIVEYEEGGQTTEVRAFITVIEDHEKHYTSIGRIMSEVELREQVVLRAWQELQVWQRRYETLTELTPIFKVINELHELDDAAE